MNGTLDDLLKIETDQRLFRLFAVGCCRQIWPLLKDQRNRTAVEVAERYADGQTTRKELRKAYYAANAAACVSSHYPAHDATNDDARYAAYAAANAAAHAAAHVASYAAACYAAYDAANAAANDAAREKQLELYNCLFTKIVFTTTSPNALNLAKLIYLERNWTLMPILGDALEEAGVSEEAVSHCKEKEHARGCWVVDNLLGHRK